MSYHFQMLGTDYILLVLSIYICVRGLMAKGDVYIRRFCHFSHAVMALEAINVVLRLRLVGVITPSRGMTYWLYAIYFVILTLAAFEWDVFFEVAYDKDYLKSASRITLLCIPLFVMTILCVITYYTDWLYYIDENGFFQNGPLFILQYILPYTYAVKFAFGMLRVFRQKNERRNRTIVIMFSTITPVLIGTAIQIMVRGSYVVSGFVVGSLIAYIELTMEEKSRLDKFAALGEVNKELEKNLQRINESFDIIKSMSLAYNACYLVSIPDNKYTEISTNIAGIHNVFGEAGNATQQLEVFAKHACMEEYGDIMREFTDFSTMTERMKGNKFISQQFEDNLNGWGEAVLIPVEKDDDGQLKKVIFATVDINNRKILEFEHENMIQMALDEAKAANRAKTIFLNNMSHDIRTPMNAIVGFTNLAQKNIDNKALTEEYLGHISDASEHLLLLINDILDLSRIESGKLQVMEKEVDLTKFINDLSTIVQPEIDAKGLHFECDTSGIENQYVVTDRLRLEQILLNILSNAVKYTEKGGSIKFTAKQTTAEKAGRAAYEFRVKDTGIGMTQEFVDHIFEAFIREENDTVNSIQGTGLGMAITKSFVDLLKGDIEVKSEISKGSEFVVRFSFAVCSGVMEDYSMEDIDFSGNRLLLVEDNLLNQEIAKAILEELGFLVEVANNGQEAVDVMKKSNEGYFNVILMDIRMPILNGYDATKAIRKLDSPVSSIPIVAMTANAFEEDKRLAFEAGMNAHLAKPIDIKLLKTTLARVIGGK